MRKPRSIGAAPAGWGEEFSATLRLAAPLVLSQLTQIAIYSTDVLMLGRLGAQPLAASALAVNLFFMFNFTGMGLVSACAPLIAAALGNRANAVRDVRRSFRSALYVALVFCCFGWLSCGTPTRSCCCSARIRRCPPTPACSCACCNGRFCPIS